MNYLEHHITDHCNLKCKGCSHFSPLAQEWFESIEDFKRDFKQLASLMPVEIIRLMGGEPLLHPKIADFLIAARELFPLSQIQLVTNGILLPSHPELIKIINDNHIIVCISDYNILKDFQKHIHNIKYLRVDNKNSLYNISLNLAGTENIVTAFNHCDLHYNHWNYFQNGKFYHCCIGANIHIFNQYFNKNLPVPEGISIYEHTTNEIMEYLDTPLPLCAYCNTIKRQQTYSLFQRSNKEISEWIYQ